MSQPVRKSVAVKRNNSTQFHIAVRSYCSFDVQGTVMHALTKKQVCFESILPLLNFMELCINEHGNLQQTHRPREWAGLLAKAGTEHTEEDDLMTKNSADTGNAPSFVVRVQFRYNATWQGTLQWLEGNETMHFRSTLEMIRLMENVVEQSGLPTDDGEEAGHR